jgi:hypothetical protein
MRFGPFLALLALALCSIASADVHFTVNTSSPKAISPYIYGTQAFSSFANYTNVPLTRIGGNRLTAYNWENNASNAGSDWSYQNDGSMSNSSTPGAALRPDITAAQNNNAAIVLTVPMNGYVSADKSPGGDVRNSGANYLSTRFKVELPAKGSAFTLTPSTSDAYVYQDEFVNWVNQSFPGAQNPAHPVFYCLDNEPDLWSSTHAEVHPAAVTYAEMISKSTAYATAIKNVSPSTMIFGPVNYGWQGYVNLQNAPDAAGRDFLNFYLSQMKAASTTAGKRLVDVLDLHWYPEAYGGGQRITVADASAAVAAARIQAPRSLWDSTYVENSWIVNSLGGAAVNLLPRIQGKINANDPGMKIAITEYNYGGGGDISGGIAQADVLGIFGKQGVYAAAEWPLNSDETYIGAAFRMYRNFDGHNSTFGDTSVTASTDNVANSSIYASTDSTDSSRMVLVAINKTSGNLNAIIPLPTAPNGRPFKEADIYDLVAGNATPQFVGKVAITNPANFSYNMPGNSVNTIVLITPEPGSVCLLGAGALSLLLAWLRRWRRVG